MSAGLRERAGSRGTVFNNGLYVTIYKLRRAGATAVANVANILGIYDKTLKKWLENDTYLREAWDEGGKDHGEARDGGQAKFRDFVYGRLPPRLRELWDEIQLCEDDANGYRRAMALLEDKGHRVRQHIFMYALVAYNFNPSVAMKKVGVSKRQYDLWAERDPEFVALLDEMHWHYKNFIQGSLNALIESGDSPATIFANRTINRDRGFSEKHVVEHTGAVEHRHSAGLSLQSILPHLSIEAREEILTVLREHQEAAGLPRLPGEVFPATRVTTVEDEDL